MYSRGIRKYISNPAIGLLPFIIYITLHIFPSVSEGYALVISLAVAVVTEIFTRFYLKSKSFSIVFYISTLALVITLGVWYLTHDFVVKINTYIVLCEILIICAFIILRLSKTYIAANFFRKKSQLQKALMNEFYHAAAFIQYGLTLHIFALLLYRQFTPLREYVHFYDVIIFSVTPILIVVGIGIYQSLKLSSLFHKLRKEDWIPIVTEKGEVTGKIAKNVSFNMKNRFLHPVVRVALISNSRVYLQERPLNDILNPGKLDYPFEKYLLFNHEINLAARNSIIQMIGSELDVPIRFILKYVFENDDTKRLNFLFTVNVEDEEIIKREGKMKGKFWTIKQIEEGFADEIFSECFELEFEYLKNMVLLAPIPEEAKQ